MTIARASTLARFALSLAAIAGLLALAPARADAAVWTDSRTWDQAAEDEYSAWVENEFNEDLFTTGAYKDIPTDCADAAYFARMIFAYEHKLPFVIAETIDGKRISNRMNAFDYLAPEKRFRSFMRRVGEEVSTATIGEDTYPVKVTRQWVRPGGVWSRPRLDREGLFGAIASWFESDTSSSGHVAVIKRIEPTGVIWLIESTVPKAVRALTMTSNLYFLPEKGKNVETGLRYWRQPQHYGVSNKELPGYSEEQFEIGIETRSQSGESNSFTQTGGRRTLPAWREEVYARLSAGQTESQDDTARRIARNFCTAARARVNEVNRALKRQETLGGHCMSADDYDDYSTPSRDKRALGIVEDLISLKTVLSWSKESAVKKVSPFLDDCGLLEIAPGKTLSLAQFALRLKSGKISSDPNDPVEARWGEVESLNRECPRPAEN